MLTLPPKVSVGTRTQLVRLFDNFMAPGLQFLSRFCVELVETSGSSLCQSCFRIFDTFLDPFIETEDSGIAYIKFSSGTLGSLVWTTCVHNKNYEGSITIIGETGTIKIGGRYLNKIEFWDVQGYPLPEGVEFTDKPNAYGKYQGTSSNHDKVYAALLDYLEFGKEGTVDGFEGMKSITAIEAIYQNARHA